MTGTLGMFVKYPEAGRVKTRLAAQVGNELASRLYRAFLMDLVPRFRDIAVRRVLAYTPNDDRTRDSFERLSQGHYELWSQPEGTLGQRMEAFFETFGSGPTVLIGSDSPTLATIEVEEALRRLTEVDCVLGPTTDGGLYLIGLRGKSIARILRPIEWSTSHVLEQTLAEIRRCNFSWEVRPLWYDIDTLDDVNFLRGHLAVLQQMQPELWRELSQTGTVLDVLAAKPQL
ncbi:MAG: TIGR04282 family arsenosugar biosynthesis glycosyltransferase [Planctomycetaceae bacterium]|nr:TIGR04282 family arsenosugar biosynthesis glycosyltransferase [Planctomycetaceae bacterium]